VFQITPAFGTAIANGYTMYSVANVLSAGAVVPDFAGIPISDGSITIDRKNAQRRTMTLTIATTSAMIPLSVNDTLTPFGNEISISVGWIDMTTGMPYINPTTGQPELVPLGVFPITTVTVDDTGKDISISVAGSDRSWVVAQRKFLLPYTVLAGTAPEVAIQAILALVYPTLPTLNMIPTGFSLPAASFNQGDDPMAACLTLADDAGCELFMDPNGVPTGFPIPDPTTQPVAWNYRTDGTGDAKPTEVKRTFTRSGVSNDFTVSATGSANAPGGSGASAPFQEQSTDSDPGSVTNISGPFGDVPTFVSSSLVTTAAQGTASAATLLAASLGLAESYVVTAPPAPMFDIDDVIGISDPRIGVNCLMVIDAISLSLRHDGTVTITGRRV
jgi:hypothetical protein